MKICLAQIKSFKGDISKNTEVHKKYILLASEQKADIIIFPELSLSGYEPTLAKDLAKELDDSLFHEFQKISNSKNITVGLGYPIIEKGDIFLSIVLIKPNQAISIYAKKFLHDDEKSFFKSGNQMPAFEFGDKKIGLAICYEISIKDHMESLIKSGIDILIASVCKTKEGISKGCETLMEYSIQNSLPILLCNSVGPNDDFISAGKSSIWDNNGKLIEQLGMEEEGMIYWNA